MTAQNQQVKSSFQIDSATQNGETIDVLWKDGHKSVYNNLWLMDACRCKQCFQDDTLSVNPGNDPLTMPLSPSSNSVDVEQDGSLKIVWDDPRSDHESIFDSAWLRVHCQSETGRSLARKTWDKTLDMPTFDFNDVVSNDDALFVWLDSIIETGVSIIENAPRNEEAFRELAARVGFLHTRYHPSNVFTLDTTDKIAQKIQHAYKLDRLFYHSDLTAYTDSGVIQLLHCLEYNNSNQEAEGYSIIADGFKLAEVLRKEYPEHYKQLTEEYAPACRRRMVAEEKVLQEGGEALGNVSQNNTIGKYAWESYRLNHVIKLDEWGNPAEVRFNHNTRAPLSMPHDKVKSFYQAYRKFVELLEDQQYTKEFLLKPGQVLICDNGRILHGRTEVGSTLKRKVLGTYVKGESFKSRWRLLLGQKAQMNDFWLTGLSDKALETLANRFV